MEHLLFDLDGTLTDPFIGITTCIRHALHRLGVENPTDETLRGWIGPPLRESFASYLHSSDEALLERAVLLYRERFASVGMYENRVYEGIPALLAAVHSAGPKLYLATSKPHLYARKILQHFGLSRYFQAIHGSELDGSRSHKSELIHHLLIREQIGPASALMVGDRQYDIHGARDNHVQAVGVTWGYGSTVELLAAGASQVVHSPRELQEWLLDTVDTT